MAVESVSGELSMQACIVPAVAGHNHLATKLVEGLGEQLVQYVSGHPAGRVGGAGEFNYLRLGAPVVPNPAGNEVTILVDHAYSRTAGEIFSLR